MTLYVNGVLVSRATYVKIVKVCSAEQQSTVDLFTDTLSENIFTMKVLNNTDKACFNIASFRTISIRAALFNWHGMVLYVHG